MPKLGLPPSVLLYFLPNGEDVLLEEGQHCLYSDRASLFPADGSAAQAADDAPVHHQVKSGAGNLRAWQGPWFCTSRRGMFSRKLFIREFVRFDLRPGGNTNDI